MFYTKYDDFLIVFLRSKTPTAELYASTTQEKDRLPNRPKTPLVDTRNMRSKTPTALAGANATPFTRNDASRASLGGNAQQQHQQQNGSNYMYNQMVDQMQNMQAVYGNTAYHHPHQVQNIQKIQNIHY